MNFRILSSAAPVLVFLALSQVAPAWASISGGFIASAAVFVVNRRDHLIGFLAAFGFVVLTLSAVLGLLWSSEKAYLAAGPISDFLFVPVYVGSILVGQPLVGGIARELLPAVAGKLEPRAPLFVWLSLAWAGANVVQGLVRVYLLTNMTVGEYVIWSRVLGLPLTATMLGISAFLIYRAAERRTREARRFSGAVA